MDSSDTVLDVTFSEQESTSSADDVFDENEQSSDDGLAGSQLMSAQDAEEMIQQLKEKFEASVSRSEKLTILMIFLKVGHFIKYLEFW